MSILSGQRYCVQLSHSLLPFRRFADFEKTVVKMTEYIYFLFLFYNIPNILHCYIFFESLGYYTKCSSFWFCSE
jgi:hypothetical protein